MKRTINVHLVLALGLGLTLTLLGFLGNAVQSPAARAADQPRPASAPGDMLCVALEGGPYAGCSQVFTNVQAAVDAASGGEIIKVATSVYTDIHVRPRNDVETTGVVTQIVHVTKTLTIQGGYTTTNWAIPYPMTQPTTLDAQGQGRVIYIAGEITPTIKGLHITGGNGARQGGFASPTGLRDGGGGVYVYRAKASLIRNTIRGNTALLGGGMLLYSSPSFLDGNLVISNTGLSAGSGIHPALSDSTLANNVIADNYSTSIDPYGGSGLLVGSSDVQLLHNTIVRNTGGGGMGVALGDFAYDPSLVVFTNTIVASQTVGIQDFWGNAAILNNVLWFDNGTNIIRNNSAITVTREITGDPAFAPDGYHLTAASAAIDRGIDAGVTTDIDDQTRPYGSGYDLGADEFPAALSVTKHANPTAQAGERLTYTLRVTNTGDMDLHATITDTLPAHVTSGKTSGGTVLLPGQPFTWTVFIPPSGIWTETVIVTVEVGYSGPLTNVVQVTTAEGATGSATTTVQAQVTPALALTQQASADSVKSGSPLTYTLRVTNTGNADLHTTITDTLPAHVTPTGLLTWTATIPAPGGVWSQTVVVTVERGYTGTLTNLVQVTTAEGATGMDSVTVNVINYKIYLPLVLKSHT